MGNSAAQVWIMIHPLTNRRGSGKYYCGEPERETIIEFQALDKPRDGGRKYQLEKFARIPLSFKPSQIGGDGGRLKQRLKESLMIMTWFQALPNRRGWGKRLLGELDGWNFSSVSSPPKSEGMGEEVGRIVELVPIGSVSSPPKSEGMGEAVSGDCQRGRDQRVSSLPNRRGWGKEQEKYCITGIVSVSSPPKSEGMGEVYRSPQSDGLQQEVSSPPKSEGMGEEENEV